MLTSSDFIGIQKHGPGFVKTLKSKSEKRKTENIRRKVF